MSCTRALEGEERERVYAWVQSYLKTLPKIFEVEKFHGSEHGRENFFHEIPSS